MALFQMVVCRTPVCEKMIVTYTIVAYIGEKNILCQCVLHGHMTNTFLLSSPFNEQRNALLYLMAASTLKRSRVALLSTDVTTVCNYKLKQCMYH